VPPLAGSGREGRRAQRGRGKREGRCRIERERSTGGAEVVREWDWNGRRQKRVRREGLPFG